MKYIENPRSCLQAAFYFHFFLKRILTFFKDSLPSSEAQRPGQGQVSGVPG